MIPTRMIPTRTTAPALGIRRKPQADIDRDSAAIDAKCRADLAAARATPGFKTQEERVQELRAKFAQKPPHK